MAFRSRRSWSICGLPQSPVPAFFRLLWFVWCQLQHTHDDDDEHDDDPPDQTQTRPHHPRKTHPEDPRSSSALSFLRWIATEVFWNSVV